MIKKDVKMNMTKGTPFPGFVNFQNDDAPGNLGLYDQILALQASPIVQDCKSL